MSDPKTKIAKRSSSVAKAQSETTVATATAAATVAQKLMEMQQQQQMQSVQMALQGAAPRLYASNISVAYSNTDVALVLMTNNIATGVLNIPYIAAKSLIKDLQGAVDTFEKASKTKIKSMEEIGPEMAKLGQARNAQKL